MGDVDEVKAFLGDWPKHLTELRAEYAAASPYPHIVIPNFFNEAILSKLADEFPPADDPAWHIYDNPMESKKVLNV
jgi:hypothetical protein